MDVKIHSVPLPLAALGLAAGLVTAAGGGIPIDYAPHSGVVASSAVREPSARARGLSDIGAGPRWNMLNHTSVTGRGWSTADALRRGGSSAPCGEPDLQVHGCPLGPSIRRRTLRR
jgi:hypothetical protein